MTMASLHSLTLRRKSRPAIGAPLSSVFLRARFAHLPLRDRLIVSVLKVGIRISRWWGYCGLESYCRLLERLAAKPVLTVSLAPDSAFAFPIGDPHWSELLVRQESYEIDVERFLKKLTYEKYTMIDCSRDYGFWPVVCSSFAFGAQRAIAIEPSPEAFDVLQTNAVLNANRFLCLTGAIADGPARVDGLDHQAPTNAVLGTQSETYDTFALDDLQCTGLISTHEKVLVKLGAMGEEVSTLRRAQHLLAQDCVLIGNDQKGNHALARYILDSTPLDLFCYDQQTEGFVEVTDIDLLDRIEHGRADNLTLFATASELWRERLANRQAVPSSAKNDDTLMKASA